MTPEQGVYKGLINPTTRTYLGALVRFRFNIGPSDIQLLQKTVFLVAGHVRHVHVGFLIFFSPGNAIAIDGFIFNIGKQIVINTLHACMLIYRMK